VQASPSETHDIQTEHADGEKSEKEVRVLLVNGFTGLGNYLADGVVIHPHTIL
jgi:hypothetical protein